MPDSLARLTLSSPLPRGHSGALSRRTFRALTALEERTLFRVAAVQAEDYVQTEKLHVIDHLSREALTGQAMLRKWVDVVAAGDPTLAGELLFFTDLARLSKGEVIADTVDTFSREGRS